MQHEQIRNSDKKNERHSTVSTVLPGGSIVELLYDPGTKQTSFAASTEGSIVQASELETKDGRTLVPISQTNNLVQHEIVLLPSNVAEYESTGELLAGIREYIHRYVDLSPGFEHLTSYYVLLSWVYDAFNELPYLRFRGDFGSGKTRALITVGSLCYKAFFASGASTVSPIFHTLDTFKGTLIFDEADFRFTDEKAELVKILNNGNVRGFPVLRTAMTVKREFDPRAFFVFGPKIVAMRGSYEDRALESRFLTDDMGKRPTRADIPINLPASQKEEARLLRNKLLLYRFRNYHRVKIDPSLVDTSLESRLNQICVPLLSIIDDEAVRDEVKRIARSMQTALVGDRSTTIEAHVLQAVAGLLADDRPSLTIAEITSAFNLAYSGEYDRLVTNRRIGAVLRKKLLLEVYKSHGNYHVALRNRETLILLMRKYGVEFAFSSRVDEVDVGT